MHFLSSYEVEDSHGVLINTLVRFISICTNKFEVCSVKEVNVGNASAIIKAWVSKEVRKSNFSCYFHLNNKDQKVTLPLVVIVCLLQKVLVSKDFTYYYPGFPDCLSQYTGTYIAFTLCLVSVDVHMDNANFKSEQRIS